MVDETEQRTSSAVVRKRKNIPKKRRDSKKLKGGPGMGKKVRVSQKMQKLYRKRARDYNSDSDDGDEDEDEREHENESASESDGEDMEFERDDFAGVSDDEAEDDRGEDSDEEQDVQAGITKFAEGCKAFRLAFRNIMKKNVDDESLGPVLSAHKNLVVEKLAEEATERKVKGEAKKEKQVIEEKGHVKPANFLDSREKFLIGVATKGVVKLFNAVNKAQMAQKGLNPSSFKDAKALTKRRKEAFITELNKANAQSTEATKASAFKGEDQPAWAPLRDTFMLTNSKLKDWDKMAEDEEEADI